jgi:molecular chaperone GrpE
MTTDPTSTPETPPSEAAPPEDRVAMLEAQLKEQESKYLYLYADFENYKKRAVKERSDALQFGWEPIARDLLQVVDNLDRALAHAPDGLDATFKEGLLMVQKLFISSLEKRGVRPIEAIGRPFDPNFHDAVGQDLSDLPQGSVCREESKGYLLHGRLLRPAKVLVSMGQKG